MKNNKIRKKMQPFFPLYITSSLTQTECVQSIFPLQDRTYSARVDKYMRCYHSVEFPAAFRSIFHRWDVQSSKQ